MVYKKKVRVRIFPIMMYERNETRRNETRRNENKQWLCRSLIVRRE